MVRKNTSATKKTGHYMRKTPAKSRSFFMPMQFVNTSAPSIDVSPLGFTFDIHFQRPSQQCHLP
jgi:hypothetical protein